MVGNFIYGTKGSGSKPSKKLVVVLRHKREWKNRRECFSRCCQAWREGIRQEWPTPKKSPPANFTETAISKLTTLAAILKITVMKAILEKKSVANYHLDDGYDDVRRMAANNVG